MRKGNVRAPMRHLKTRRKRKRRKTQEGPTLHLQTRWFGEWAFPTPAAIQLALKRTQ